MILIANYNSYSKAVNYIIDNFATLDILSDDIDFQVVGYSNENKKPLESNQIAKDEILNKALNDLDSISPDERISQAEIEALREKLISLRFANDTYDEDYHGNTKKQR